MKQVQTVRPLVITREKVISGGCFWQSPALRGHRTEQETVWPVCPTDSRVDKVRTPQEHWVPSCQKRKGDLPIEGNQGTAPSSSCGNPLNTSVTMSDQLQLVQIKKASGKFSTSLAHTIDGWWMNGEGGSLESPHPQQLGQNISFSSKCTQGSNYLSWYNV